MADCREFSSSHVSMMTVANSVCNLWLHDESVNALLRCVNRADVSARLSKAFDLIVASPAGSPAGGIRSRDASAFVELFVRHLIDARSSPIPLGEDVIDALIHNAAQKLCQDKAFQQFSAILPGEADFSRFPGTATSELFSVHDIPVKPQYSRQYSTSWGSGDTVSEGRSRGGSWESTSFEIRGRTIVFEWDEVLMPTRWVSDVLAPRLSHLEGLNPWNPDESRLLVLQADAELSRTDSAFCGVLEGHARAVVNALRAACEVANVAIVTFAPRACFEQSFTFFPGVDMRELIEELQIQIIFAPGPEDLDASEDSMSAEKRQVLAELLGNGLGDVLSIGSRHAASREWPLREAAPCNSEQALAALTHELERFEAVIWRLFDMGAEADLRCDQRILSLTRHGGGRVSI